MATIHPAADLGVITGYKPAPDRKLSEEEFLAWCDEDMKAEWVDGQVIMMSPVNLRHVELTLFLASLLKTWVDERELGKILGPEFTVRLGSHSRRVPDLMFVAKDRLPNLRLTHLEGPPDVAIEVVSPDSVDRDWREKYADYQAFGVREYWVIDPAYQRVEAYRLVDGAYDPVPHDQGRIASSVLAGFYLREEWLWRAELPKVSEALKDLEAAGG